MVLATTIGGIPAASVLLLVMTWGVVVLAYVLYRIDVKRTGGYVSVFGWGGGE